MNNENIETVHLECALLDRRRRQTFEGKQTGEEKNADLTDENVISPEVHGNKQALNFEITIHHLLMTSKEPLSFSLY